MPASRPDKPADAVREMFATNRMQAAWNTLSRATTDVERLIALNAIVRMLEGKGLVIADVAETIAAPATRTAPNMTDAFGFGDIFSHMRRAAPENGAQPPRGNQPMDAPPAAETQKPTGKTWRPRPGKIVQGDDMPGRIYGRIELRDERPIPKGKMMVLGVIGQEAVYDPIVCFDEKVIERIRIAAQLDRVVSLKIRKPGKPGQMPCAIAID